MKGFQRLDPALRRVARRLTLQVVPLALVVCAEHLQNIPQAAALPKTCCCCCHRRSKNNHPKPAAGSRRTGGRQEKTDENRPTLETGERAVERSAMPNPMDLAARIRLGETAAVVQAMGCGFIPGPSESREDFASRIELQQGFSVQKVSSNPMYGFRADEFAYLGRFRGATAVDGILAKDFGLNLSQTTLWIVVSSKNLPLFAAAVSYTTKHGCFVQISPWFQWSATIIAHECIHFARSGFTHKENTPVEAWAYGVSPALHYRRLGGMFSSRSWYLVCFSWLVSLSLSRLLLSGRLGQPVAAAGSRPRAAASLLLSKIPVVAVMVFLFWRQQSISKTLAHADAALSPLVSSRLLRQHFLFRLSWQEISRLAEMARRQVVSDSAAALGKAALCDSTAWRRDALVHLLEALRQQASLRSKG